MRKGDKKGLSTIVATLLIILLVIVAIAIVWGVVRTILSSNAKQISLGKFTVDLEILDVYPSTPSNPTTGIKVRRNVGEGELEGIVFSIFDGKKTHIFEKKNISLEELEVKTFFVDYNGTIVSVSIYPIFLGSSGNTLTGDMSDTYYYTGGDSGGGYIAPGCIANCTGKTACQDDGCAGNCGLECSGSTPYCVNGACSADTGGLTGDCTCSVNICLGTTCDDGLGGSCFGELSLQQDCGSLMCGQSPRDCGSCGSCDYNYTCNGGMCSPDCLSSACGLRVCGGILGRDDCGQTFCGTCTIPGETCNETTGTCFVCQPDCAGKNCGDNGCGGECGDCNAAPFNSSYTCVDDLCKLCTPECAVGQVCGNSSNDCGACGECTGQDICLDGTCIPPEESINNGTVVSVWPLPIGRNLFVSDGLPMYGEPYNLDEGNFVKIISIYSRCYPILLIDYPVNPGQYTVIKVSTASTDIEVGDRYEIWKTLEGCNR